MEFTELLQTHNIPYARGGDHRHAREGWVQFDCPFCGVGTHKFHMGFSIDGGYVNCWRCGHHSVHNTIRHLLQLSYTQSRVVMRQIKFYDRPFPEQIKTAGGTLKVPNGVGELKKVHRNYLRSRHFNPKEVFKLWELEGTTGFGVDPKYAWRIMIPIFYKGDQVSWTTRALGSSRPRYLSASPDQEVLSHKELLYGEDYCRHSVVVVEGPTDVWRIGPGAVATFGTNFSRAQVLKLSKYPHRIVCFDNNGPAQKAAKDLFDLLTPFPGSTFNVVLDSEDPGSASKKEVRRLKKSLLTWH